MMYGYGSMMSGGFWPFSLLTWLVVFVDLVLLGVFLWQRVAKK